MRNLLDFHYSPWLILVCLLIGGGYSYLQYSKKVPWSGRLNLVLAAIRGLIVSAIAILILGPTMRVVQNYYEKPIFVFAIDNSESVPLATDATIIENTVDKLTEIKASLEQNDWQVKTVNLTGQDITLDSILFDETRTDLTALIRREIDKYDGANLGAMLVLSDGIFNAGFSPDLISAYHPVYSLGIGDTIPKMDLSIIDVDYNKTVYQDNKFPVTIRIRNEGVGNESTKLRIYQSGQLAETKDLEIASDTRIIEHEFTLEANEAGKQRISISLEAVEGEASIANNKLSFYVDVIEGQQKILLAAEAPSPDMKAFKLALEANDRFLINQVIGEPIKSADYDLIVLFNSPNFSKRVVYNSIAGLSEIPKLYFLGSSTDLRPYSEMGLIEFNQRINQYDQVTGSLNPDLTLFTLINDSKEWLANVPPMAVPFGEISLSLTSQVILEQRVGNVVTNRPIIYINEDEIKSGVVLGDGFWTWRLDEYRKYGVTDRFDEILTKLTMYLAAKPDKRQFKMYPSKDGFEIGEKMTFIAETYNQLFEPYYGEPVSLVIEGVEEKFDYNFTPLSGSNNLNIDNLSEGLYSYAATTFLDGKRHSASGQFSVEKTNIEAVDLTADFLVLRKLANESGGNFYTAESIDELVKELASLEAKTVIHSQEREVLLFNLPLILILILIFASGEWLTRKMMGSY